MISTGLVCYCQVSRCVCCEQSKHVENARSFCSYSSIRCPWTSNAALYPVPKPHILWASGVASTLCNSTRGTRHLGRAANIQVSIRFSFGHKPTCSSLMQHLPLSCVSKLTQTPQLFSTAAEFVTWNLPLTGGSSIIPVCSVYDDASHFESRIHHYQQSIEALHSISVGVLELDVLSTLVERTQ